MNNEAGSPDPIQFDSNKIIRQLFGENVIGEIHRINDNVASLHPDERSLIDKACDKRRHEFSTARLCAKYALAHLGIENAVIGRGGNNEPLWPENVIGSIAHSKDLCGAVVAKKSDSGCSIGFDIEKLRTLKNDIGRIICTKDESYWIKTQPDAAHDLLIILIFSLKESIYKCIFNHNKQKLTFKNCTIIPDLSTQTASVQFHTEEFKPAVTLKFVISHEYVFSGAHLSTTESFVNAGL